MSKITLTGNASGTGVVTLTSPNTNTNRTITLPDATATIATQENFTSTGIDDNATSTAITIDASENTTFAGDVSLGDNVKAKFGASDDLQIYHDVSGDHSIITEAGAGNLYIKASNLRLQSTTGENFLEGVADGAVNLYHNDVKKLATTATGVDATGAISSFGGGLQRSTFETVGNDLVLTSNSDTSNVSSNIIFKSSTDGGAVAERMRINSAGDVGIGTTSPDTLLNLQTTRGTISTGTAHKGSVIKLHTAAQWEVGYGISGGDFLGGIEFSSGDNSDDTGLRAAVRATVDSYFNSNSLVFETAGTEKLRIQAGGGISFNGDTAAANALDDYETGTFNATLTAATAPTTACTATGHYTKIGNVCHFSIYRFEAVNTTGASGHMQITGLPFTASTDTIIPAPWTHGFDFNTAKNQFFSISGTVLYAYESTSGGAWSQWNITAGTTKYMVVNGTYRAD